MPGTEPEWAECRAGPGHCAVTACGPFSSQLTDLRFFLQHSVVTVFSLKALTDQRMIDRL